MNGNELNAMLEKVGMVRRGRLSRSLEEASRPIPAHVWVEDRPIEVLGFRDQEPLGADHVFQGQLRVATKWSDDDEKNPIVRSDDGLLERFIRIPDADTEVEAALRVASLVRAFGPAGFCARHEKTHRHLECELSVSTSHPVNLKPCEKGQSETIEAYRRHALAVRAALRLAAIVYYESSEIAWKKHQESFVGKDGCLSHKLFVQQQIDDWRALGFVSQSKARDFREHPTSGRELIAYIDGQLEDFRRALDDDPEKIRENWVDPESRRREIEREINRLEAMRIEAYADLEDHELRRGSIQLSYQVELVPSSPEQLQKLQFKKQRYWLTRVLNKWSFESGESRQLEWEGDYPRIVHVGDLWAAVVRQLRSAIQGIEGWAICSVCRNAYETHRRPRPNERRFCEDPCRSETVGRSLNRTRRGVGVRARKRSKGAYSPEFRRQVVGRVRNGEKPEEIALEVGCSASTVRNWVCRAE